MILASAQWHKVEKKKKKHTTQHTSQARWRIRDFENSSSASFIHPGCPSPLTPNSLFLMDSAELSRTEKDDKKFFFRHYPTSFVTV